MRLKEIFDSNNITVSGIGYGNICNDGNVYFCLHNDARLETDIKFALGKGAAVLVCEKQAEAEIPCFKVDDIRESFAEYSADYYNNPADNLTMIGVTGTNGKTTTTHIIKSILETAGENTGIIGTNGAYACGKEYGTALTTPDPPELHRILAEMLNDGVEAVVMEVSAHAIYLGKINGIKFEVGAFTNLTQDHLDFFGTMDNYARVKESFFSEKHMMVGVVNVDDETGVKIAQNNDIPILTYGCENPSDVFGIDYETTESGCRFVANIMDDIVEMEYCAAGRFNMSNVLCAATTAKILGVSSDDIKEGVAKMKQVNGRFQIIKEGSKRAVIDYAHTPDGLEKILKAVREITKGRIITVFGCGGDRDKTKRPLMGEIAGRLSDFTVITGDNPRSEMPMNIIKDIESGINGGNYLLVEDRREAIRLALEMCKDGDTVVVAGKGHETTQEIKGVKEHFSDAETVREFMK